MQFWLTAMLSFCRHVDTAILQPQTGKVLSLLLPLLSQAERETLYLLLETIRAITSIDDSILSAQNTGAVVEQMFDVWLRCADGLCLFAHYFSERKWITNELDFGRPCCHIDHRREH